MTRYTFGTFLVDDANREAFQVCQDMADLKPVAPQPVLLLGDTKTGKTHLLYAIVSRIKSGSADTRFAYITAHDFPPQVRALVADPRPVQRGKPAVLLVDQLERFTENTADLEAIVRLFLENGHYVAVASNLHPARLPHLPEGLRTILERGKAVSVGLGEGGLDLLKHQARREHEALIEEQRREIAELRARIGELSSEPASDLSAELTQTRQQLERLEAEREELRNQVQVARTLVSSLERDLAAVREELDEARQALARRAPEPAVDDAHYEALREELAQARAEVEALRQTAGAGEATPEHESEIRRLTEELEQVQNRHREERRHDEELRAELAREKEALENDLQALREQLDQTLQAAAEERERLQAELESLRGATVSGPPADAAAGNGSHDPEAVEDLRKRIELLEKELTTAREERDEAWADARVARGEADALVDRARRLTEQIDAGRMRFADTEREQRARIEELERLFDMRTASLAQSQEQTEALRSELAESAARIASLEENFNAERGRLEAALTEAREQVEKEVESLRQELREAVEQRDAAREEALRSEERNKSLEAETQRLNAALESAAEERSRLEAEIAARDRRLEAESEKSAAQAREFEDRAREWSRQLEEATARAEADAERIRDLEQELVETRAAQEAELGELEAAVARAAAYAQRLAQRLRPAAAAPKPAPEAPPSNESSQPVSSEAHEGDGGLEGMPLPEPEDVEPDEARMAHSPEADNNPT